MVLSGTVVVTGADGFIGRACIPPLAHAGALVRGLVRSLSTDTAACSRYMPVGDLATMADSAMRTVMRDAKAVVHLAGHAHRASAPPGVLRAVNVEATARLARAAAAEGAGHFVFASSVKVNGETSLPGHPLRESDPPNPADDYGASKWAAERELSTIAEDSGMRVTSLRLPLTYGPHAKANVAALARAVRRGLPLPFAGIDNRRSILGTANLASALAALLASECDPGEAGRATAYFVADDRAVSTTELVEAMARAMRVEPRLFRVPAGLLRAAGALAGRGEAIERLLGTLEVDTSAFRERFAWSPPCGLDEGMAQALDPGAPL
ncbi:MAG: NAD-dependent epimerase/dehydratase family protein [Burkholderiales bacterium]